MPSSAGPERCWTKCQNRPGECPDFCGPGMACCRHGRLDPLPCPEDPTGLPYHVCMAATTRERTWSYGDLVRAHALAVQEHPGLLREGTSHFLYGSLTRNLSSYFVRCEGACSQSAVVKPMGGTILMGSADVKSALKLLLDWGAGGDVLIFGARASAPSKEDPDYFHRLVAQQGFAHSVTTLLLRQRAATENQLVLACIDNADAIIFAGGGDRWDRLFREWRNTSLHVRLRAAIARGVPVAGTWSTCDLEGTCKSAAHDESSMEGRAASPPFLRLQPAHILESLVFDSHFVERDRMKRLVTMVAWRWIEGRRVLGLGIDSATAVAVDSGGRATLLAEGLDGGRVYVLDPKASPTTCCSLSVLEWKNVSVQKLDAYQGDEYDLVQRRGGAQSQRYNVSLEGGMLRPRNPFHPPWMSPGFVSTNGRDRRDGTDHGMPKRLLSPARWSHSRR